MGFSNGYFSPQEVPIEGDFFFFFLYGSHKKSPKTLILMNHFSYSMVSLEEIKGAANMLKGQIIRTPLVYSSTFSELSGAEIYLKLETLQKGGSFKVRGAANRILSHRHEIGKAGVIAASAGNHAQGVAIAARMAGVHATIVMPEHVSISKQAATRRYGADVILKGQSLSDSITIARQLGSAGMTFIHPYDDPEIIAGQGTIGLEIIEDLPEVDIVIVPIGGGGLISGIATAVKAIRSRVRIIGAQAAACPSAYLAMETGNPDPVEIQPSIADGIMVSQTGRLTFGVIQSLVDEIVLVGEEEIAAAVLMLLERKKVLAEGAGAVPVAALLNGVLSIPPGSKVVLVISGGNVDTPLLERILRKGMLKNGRIMRFVVILEDAPGTLADLLVIIAETGGNILHIHHTSGDANLPVHVARLEIELETRDNDHISEITRLITKRGYRIQLE